MCVDESSISLTNRISLSANVSLNFSIKEITGGFENLNNLMEEELEQFSNKDNTLMVENDQENSENANENSRECECWTSERMKQFIDFLKSKFEGPLLKELDLITDKNRQLRHDLNKCRDLIENFQPDSENRSNIDAIKSALSDKLKEIEVMNIKLAKQSELIEEFVNNEEDLFEKNSQRLKGN